MWIKKGQLEWTEIDDKFEFMGYSQTTSIVEKKVLGFAM